MSASAPIVMRERGQFSLERDIHVDAATGALDTAKTHFKSTKQYIDDAATATNGRAISSTSRGFANSLNLEVKPLVRFGIPKPKPAAAAAPTDPDAPVAPEAGEPAVPLPTPPDDGELTPPNFSLFGEIGADATTRNDAVDSNLFSGGPDRPDGNLSITSQQSVLLGTNAKLTELAMRKMADPEKAAFTNPGKTVHVAIVQVSCNPGWRTRENYIADITASCEYYYSQTHQIVSEIEGRRPVVFSVLPLVDAQSLETQNSQREIIDLVAQVSAAYPAAKFDLRGKDVIKFVKDYRSTVATKTPKTITNSYSSGNQFGFRFSPSLVAIKDPAERHSPSANVLQSTVLPVLIMFVTDQGWTVANEVDSVMVHISHRWLLNDRPPLRKFFSRFARPMARETTWDRSKIASDVRAASEQVAKVFGGPLDAPYLSPVTSPEYQFLRRDLKELSSKVLGSSNVVFAFPEPGRRNHPGHPVISSVYPKIIPIGIPTRVAVWGHFLPAGADVSVAGIPATDVSVGEGGRQLVCTVNVPASVATAGAATTVIVESDGTFDSYDHVKFASP